MKDLIKIRFLRKCMLNIFFGIEPNNKPSVPGIYSSLCCSFLFSHLLKWGIMMHYPHRKTNRCKVGQGAELFQCVWL